MDTQAPLTHFEQVNESTGKTPADDRNSSAGVSFDSMENFVDGEVQNKSAKKEEKKSEKKVDKAPKEEKKGDKEDNTDELVEKVAHKEKSTSKEEKKQEAKFLKAKKRLETGEFEEFDIPEDALISVKVDGEYIDVPISEARNDFSGKKSISKRFTEFDKVSRAHAEQVKQLDQKIAKLIDSAKSGRAIDALDALSMLAGDKASEVKGTLLQSLLDEAQRLSGMSDGEREAEMLRHENETFKRQKTEESERAVLQRKIYEAEQAAEQVIDDFGVDSDEFMEVVTEMSKRHKKAPYEIAPHDVILNIKGKHISELIEQNFPQIFEAASESPEENKRLLSFWEGLTHMATRSRLTDEKILNIISEEYSIKRKRSAVSEVNSKLGPITKREPKEPDTVMTWNDL